MYQEKIKQFMWDHKDEFLADLAKLIAVDSVRGEEVPGKPYGEGPAKVLDLFLEMAAGYGFHTENWEYRVGFASFGPDTEGRKLDITAHLDIVPVGEGWEMTEPLVMKEIDGKVYFTSSAGTKYQEGELVDVKITAAMDYDLVGETVL